MTSPFTLQTPLVRQLQDALASWLADGARSALEAAVAAAGASTEPNFAAVVPVYDRMLAVAGFLAVVCACGAVAERVVGGSHGAGASVLLRLIAATVFSFEGIRIVAELSSLSSALSGMWAQDSVDRAAKLWTSLGDLGGLMPSPGGLPVVLGTVLLLLIALLVYVELVLRSALLLVSTAFIPVVSALATWPRLAGGASHMARFLLALIIAKFAIATALEVGLVLAGQARLDALGLLLTGIATLLAAAFSPAILFQGLRHHDSSVAALGRSWVSTAGRATRSAATAAVGPSKAPGAASSAVLRAIAARSTGTRS